MAETMDWHHYFGLFLEAFFRGTPFDVTVEPDLSRNRQLLDLVVVKRRPGELRKALPDGFDDLAEHNLITFKSYQGTFDAWAVKELVGHYVNYRKQFSPSMNELMPESDLRLFGVSARFPQKLASEVVELEQPMREVSPGVYNIAWGTDRIRLIVIRELPESDANAMFHLFSSAAEQVNAARLRYNADMRDASTLVYRVLNRYLTGGGEMAVNLEKFIRETREEVIATSTPEERLRGLPPEERLRGLPPEERLRGLPVEDRLRNLTPEEIVRAQAALERMLKSSEK